jgi:hypothetical protein
MDQQQAEQNQFKGFVLLELYGHQTDAGFLETVYFGSACMFRLDVPGLDEREWALERPEYGQHTGYKELPVGTKVKRAAVAPRSRLLGVGAIYGMTPCTEEVVRAAIERSIARPLIVLEMPKGKELAAGEPLPGEGGRSLDTALEGEDDYAEDTGIDRCPDCGAAEDEDCREGCPNA